MLDSTQQVPAISYHRAFAVRRFSFTPAFVALILRAIQTTRAYITDYGKATEKYKLAFPKFSFQRNMTFHIGQTGTQASRKIDADRF